MTKYYNCPICDSQIEHLENQNDTAKFKTSSGSKLLKLEGLSYSKCSSCGEIFYDADELDLRERKASEILDRK